MLSRARFPDPWSNFHHATRPEFNCAIANAGTMQSCSTTVKLNVTSLLLNSNSHLSRSLVFVTHVLDPNVLALPGIPHPAPTTQASRKNRSRPAYPVALLAGPDFHSRALEEPRVAGSTPTCRVSEDCRCIHITRSSCRGL